MSDVGKPCLLRLFVYQPITDMNVDEMKHIALEAGENEGAH